MQNNFFKIDEYAFDRELAQSDDYGHSIILCNFLTCQKLLNDTDQKHCYNYKGHTIYIDQRLSDFEYRIYPLIKLNELENNGLYQYTNKEATYNAE